MFLLLCAKLFTVWTYPADLPWFGGVDSRQTKQTNRFLFFFQLSTAKDKKHPSSERVTAAEHRGLSGECRPQPESLALRSEQIPALPSRNDPIGHG